MPNLKTSPIWRPTIKEALEDPESAIVSGRFTDDIFSKIEDWDNNREYEIDRISDIIANRLPENVSSFLSTITKKDLTYYWIRVYFKIED